MGEPTCAEVEDITEQQCDVEHPGWSPYIEGILDSRATAQHVQDSIALARQFVDQYDVVAHWYLSWEAFLPALLQDITYTPAGHVKRTKAQNDLIRAAYAKYQTLLINSLSSVAQRSFLWSPSVDQPLRQFDVDRQRLGEARTARGPR